MKCRLGVSNHGAEQERTNNSDLKVKAARRKPETVLSTTLMAGTLFGIRYCAKAIYPDRQENRNATHQASGVCRES